ncbi:MAG: HEAT repeat domain-containing protein [Anaerolineae bacterium]|jgi:HEAT repeat protein
MPAFEPEGTLGIRGFVTKLSGDLKPALRRLLVAVAPGLYTGRYQAVLFSDSAYTELEVPGREEPLDLEGAYLPLRLVKHQRSNARAEDNGAQEAPAREGVPGGQGRGAAITIEDALLQYSRVVILGGPGSGKTTLFRHLALTLAQDNLPLEYVRKLTFTHQDEARDHLLPLFVSLPDLAQRDADVVGYLSDRLTDHEFPCSREFLDRRLEQGDCLLLLDGLDGIADEDQRRRVIDKIEALRARCGRKNLIIVSSRLVGYRYELERFVHLELASFDDEDVERFVTNWFAEQPTRAHDLLVALERSPRLRSMAANPLLMSTLAAARERQPEPAAPSVALYGATGALLLGEETNQALKTCVQKLGYHFQRRKQPCFSTEQLSDAIARLVPRGNKGQNTTRALLTALTKRTELLRPTSKASYAFLHPSLRECLAAKEIHEGEGISALVEHVDDPWWREVIVMLAGLQRDATDLVEMILARSQEGDEALLLAAHCLFDADQTDEDLRRRIRAGLFEIFERDEPALWSRAAATIAGLEGQRKEQAFGGFLRGDDLQLRRGAATGLGRICEQWGVPLLIAALGDKAWQVRSRAAWALGALGDERAVYPLLKLLDDDNRDVHREAITALGGIGEPALDPLIAVLVTRSGEVPMRAARAITLLGGPAVPALVTALVSETGEVREGAAMALAEIGAPAVEPLVATAQSESPEMRRGAVAALGRIGDLESVRRIVAALGDPEEMVHREAANTLICIGGPAVPVIVEALVSGNRRVSERAAGVLAEIGDPSVDGLFEALRGDRRALRWAAAKVLGRIGARDQSVVPRLGDVLNDRRSEVPQSAVRALAEIGSDDAIDVLVGALDAEEEALRGEAANALVSVGTEGVVWKLREAFSRGVDPLQVVGIVGRIGITSARNFLRQLLRSDDRTIRDMAASALEADEKSGMYYYRAWEPRIEEHLLRRGTVGTAMLGETPSELRPVVLQRYVSSHPQMDLTYDAEMAILQLNAISRYQRVVECWDRASMNLDGSSGLSDQMFTECSRSLASALCEILGATITGTEIQERLHCFVLQVSTVTRGTNLPQEIPLILLQRDTLTESDLGDLRELFVKIRIFHRTALLIVFGEDERIRQARQFVGEKLRDVHAFDVIVLGKQEIQRIVTAKSPPDALRFAICEQADLTLVSPYSCNEPASRMLFSGRELEIRSITQAITNSSVAVLGGRRIGKTSILHRVSDLLRETYCCHYMDCHAIRDYDTLFRTIEYRWPGVGSLPAEPVSFHSVVAELRGDGPLVFALDEVDSLVRFDIENDELLFKTFRSLSQEGVCRFIFSGERVLSNQLKYGSASPLFNFCGQRIRLSYLKPKSAERLIVEPMDWMNIELQERGRVVEGILDLSSCHPRLVQYICHSLIKQINQEGVRFITPEHLQRIAGSNEFGEEYLWTVWGDATPFERALTLALEETSATLDDIEAALQRWDIPYAGEGLRRALHNPELCSILERDDDAFRFVAEHFPRIARETLDVEMEISALKREMGREPDL